MRVAICVTVAFALTAAANAHGHELHTVADPRVFSFWDKAAVAALIVLGVLYFIGSAQLVLRGARRSPVEAAAFAAGWLALIAAVLPFFDAAAIAWFSAHMAQHELMMLVGAPLVMAGRPLSTCLWALPDRWRLRFARAFQRGHAASAIRLFTAPAVAWALHGAVIWIWHVPVLYELAVRSEPAHALQHAMFVGTSTLFWWGLLYGRYGRAGYGAAVFYVFTTAVHTGILGALFTLSRTPLYSAYVNITGVDWDAALADQQIAGLVMWIPAGILLTLMGIGLFAAWLGEAERRVRAGGYRLQPPRARH